MSYEPTSWLDRIVQHPNRYELEDLGGGLFRITPEPGVVTEEGTPVSAANMNNIEEWIGRARYVQEEAPGSPQDGELWQRPSEPKVINIFYNGAWRQVGGDLLKEEELDEDGNRTHTDIIAEIPPQEDYQSPGDAEASSALSISDEANVVASAGSTATNPVGIGNHRNFGPHTVHDLIWVMYSDGTNLVYRTRDVAGGSWSSASTLFAAIDGSRAAVWFDGSHFHFTYESGGDLIYRRGTPASDGSMALDAERTAYTDVTWGPEGRYFDIFVDTAGCPWIIFQAKDNSNYKGVIVASTATDGTWSVRSGFPADVTGSLNDSRMGAGGCLTQIDDDPITMIFFYRERISTTNHNRARLWTQAEGLSTQEDTGFTRGASRHSVVSPSPGVAMMNLDSADWILHRAADGTYSNRNKAGTATSSYNGLTLVGKTVRFWDISTERIRYYETTDEGLNWSDAIVFTDRTTSSPTNMIVTHSPHSQFAPAHSLAWREGSSPYDVLMGIESFNGVPGAAIDSNTDTYWEPDPPDEADAWLYVDLGKNKRINAVQIFWPSDADYRPTDYEIATALEGDDLSDPGDWQLRQHEEEDPGEGWMEYLLAEGQIVECRYIRIKVNTHGSLGSRVHQIMNGPEPFWMHGHINI